MKGNVPLAGELLTNAVQLEATSLAATCRRVPLMPGVQKQPLWRRWKRRWYSLAKGRWRFHWLSAERNCETLRYNACPHVS